MKEYGGYLPLELMKKDEFFCENLNYNLFRLNSARSAIVLAIKSMKTDVVYIPYYNCEMVKKAIVSNNIAVKQYFLDEELQPIISDYNGEPVLVVNYFGCFSNEKIYNIVNKYNSVIIDNTQALFCEPILKTNVYNVYSCRKFLGVSDGGYLISKSVIEYENYPTDISWKRASYLLKSVEEGTNAAYRDNLKSEDDIGFEIKRMSVLTQSILSSIDYELIKEKRYRNFCVINEKLQDLNEISYLLQEPSLMIYPFLISKNIREQLVEKRIYVPQWWKYLFDIVPDDSIENRFSRYLLPLPIDQRYSEEEINEIADIIIACTR